MKKTIKTTKTTKTVVTTITETTEEDIICRHSDKSSHGVNWLSIFVENVLHHSARHFFYSVIINNIIPGAFIGIPFFGPSVAALVSLGVGMVLSFVIEKACNALSKGFRSIFRK